MTTSLPANVTIVDLPAGTTIVGSELFEAVQTTNGIGASVGPPWHAVASPKGKPPPHIEGPQVRFETNSAQRITPSPFSWRRKTWWPSNEARGGGRHLNLRVLLMREAGPIRAEMRNDPSAVSKALYAYFDRTLGVTP